MSEWFQTYQSDIIIIGILVIEIVLLTILGINALKKSRSLANVYFSTVFFVVVGLSAVNIAIRFLSIVISNKSLLADSIQAQIYMDLVSLVTAAMLVIFIIYGAGFYIINFGEKYYRDKKLFVVFIILIILTGGSIIGCRLLPDSWNIGLEFEISAAYDEFFKINIPLAVFLLAMSFIFLVVDIALLVRIFPDTQNKVQKRKLITLMVAVFSYFLGLANLIVVDMHIPLPSDPTKPLWNFLTITSVLFLFSVILLYFSIIKRKKKVEN